MTRRRIVIAVAALALLAVGAWLLGADADADDRDGNATARAGTGKVIVDYYDADRADEAVATIVEESDLADQTAQIVNELVDLPADITVNMGGDPDGPYYDPETRTIEYPWEFVSESRVLLARSGYRGAELDAALVDATRFILHHEIGHALIDQLELPVLGREEDAADGFAAYVAVEHEQDGDEVIAATDLFAAFDEQQGEELEESAFFDSHSLDLQRFYAISCQVYGADEDAYAHVIEGIGLDAERRSECPEEWELVRRGWETVLEPHLRE